MSAAAPFFYTNSIAPTMWMLIGLSAVEALAVHFLVSFWLPTLALVLTLLTLGTIVWMVLLLRSFARLPVLVEERGVTMRVGTLRSCFIPAAQLAGLHQNFSGEDVKKAGVLNLALIACPNVLVDVEPPLAGKRAPIRTIAHRLDNPDGFAAAVEALLAASRAR